MPNLLQQVGSVVQSFFQRQRTSLVKIFTAGTTEVYPDLNATNAINRGFNYNTAVYSIIKKDAKKFGSLARYVEAKSNEDKSESEELPGALTDLLNRPNNYQGQDAFLTLVRAFYKTCGEAFIWLNRGDTDMVVDDEFIQLDDEAHSKKPVLEMFVLPSNQMIIVPDPDNIYGVLGYILESNVRVPIRKVDIIHWKDVNLNFDVVSRPQLRGFSALNPGWKTLEQNNSATDASVRMYQNSGAKGVLSNKLGGQNPMQQSQVEKVLDQKINNIDVKGAVVAMQGDWAYHNLGLTSVDMELLKGKDYSMKELCFLLGLPFELFDSETTYQNKEMAQKGWVINEIIPDCKQLDGEMNRVLLKAFGLDGKAEICTDFDDMAELQEDKAKQVEWLVKAPVTVDEFREAIGYEPIGGEDGETIIMPSGQQTLDDVISSDGGNQIIQSLANVNGRANTGNGNGQIPKNGQGAKLQPGKTKA